MRLKPFLLDNWLDAYEHRIEFNLASSTGPLWTVNELLDLGGEQTRQRYMNHCIVYGRPAGADTLRAASQVTPMSALYQAARFTRSGTRPRRARRRSCAHTVQAVWRR